MATEDSGSREVYRFTGMKDPGDNTERIIVEGSTSDPKRFVDRAGTIELTEEEAKDLKDTGHKLIKLSDEQKEKLAEDSGEGEGEDQTVASGAQGAASSPAKDKRPGSPGAGKTS